MMYVCVQNVPEKTEERKEEAMEEEDPQQKYVQQGFLYCGSVRVNHLAR